MCFSSFSASVTADGNDKSFKNSEYWVAHTHWFTSSTVISHLTVGLWVLGSHFGTGSDPEQGFFLKAQWVGVRPLQTPFLSFISNKLITSTNSLS